MCVSFYRRVDNMHNKNKIFRRKNITFLFQKKIIILWNKNWIGCGNWYLWSSIVIFQFLYAYFHGLFVFMKWLVVLSISSKNHWNEIRNIFGICKDSHGILRNNPLQVSKYSWEKTSSMWILYWIVISGSTRKLLATS